MKTIKRVKIKPIFVESIPEKIEENIFYIAEQYKAVIHKCLCGCGERISTPINKDGWTLIKKTEDKISLTPSIGNFYLPCKSHYIVSDNMANFV